MFRQEKVFVGTEVQDREALCRRLTDNGATLVAAAGDPDVLHILNTFEGGIFDDCVKRSCRVLGAPIVQETLRTGKALPRSSHPVYSRVMEGLVVAGEVEEKAKLKNYVHYMNGIWVDEIGVGTNYFVTNEPGSLHYLWALELGTNIVQPSWISESWENQTLPDVKAHLLPPLSGCVISVTGLSSATRTSIQHLVTHYGGKYTQQLSRRVTHLLCDKPKGRKYMTALTWGIHIVTTNWLFDSINAKGTVDVTRYELPSLPSVDMDGGEGGYYMRSSLRSGPYNPLTSTTRRGLNYTAPILVRRHRTSMASNYAPMFSLPPPPTHSQHMHPLSSHQQPVFAQTTQIQSGPSSMLPPSRQPSSMSSQQTFSPPKTTSSSRSSRDKDVRTNMDRYRDLFDQLTGMLRMCDEVIERCTNQPLNPTTTNNTNTNNNNNITSTLDTSNNNNNTSTNNNTNTININNNNNSNRDTITNTTESAITTTTSTEPSIPPPPDPPSDVPSDPPSDPSTNLSAETINTSADPSSSSPSTTSTTTNTSTTEDNADIDMESDGEEVATVETSTASSEQEK